MDPRAGGEFICRTIDIVRDEHIKYWDKNKIIYSYKRKILANKQTKEVTFHYVIGNIITTHMVNKCRAYMTKNGTWAKVRIK
jgi:hypothetical protein